MYPRHSGTRLESDASICVQQSDFGWSVVTTIGFLLHPFPSQKDLADLPWWAVIGGLVGAVQVYAGLTLVNKVGAGPFVGFTVTAALIASLVVDHFGLLHMPVHAANMWRIAGAVLMICGIALIARN